MVRLVTTSRKTNSDVSGINLSGLKKKVAVVNLNPVLLRKALDHLVKNGNIKTFKPINVSFYTAGAAKHRLT